MAIPRNEQETTVTSLVSEKIAYCWTSRPATAEKWRKLGYPVKVEARFDGDPITWSAKVPSKCMSFRKLGGGARKGNPEALQKARSSRVSVDNSQKGDI